jgi:hypothetical protein
MVRSLSVEILSVEILRVEILSFEILRTEYISTISRVSIGGAAKRAAVGQLPDAAPTLNG